MESMNTLSAFETAAAPIAEVQHLLSFERRASRLLCLYLADLSERVQSSDGSPVPARDLHATARRFDLGVRDTRERVRIGRALRHLPQIEAAFVAGELSYSRVREITRIASPQTEGTWLELARRLDMRSLERRVASGRPTPPAPPSPSARSQPREPPPLRITFDLTPSAWSLLQRALEQNRRRSSEPLSAEALESIARSILATPRRDPEVPARAEAEPSTNSQVHAPPPDPPRASANADTTHRKKLAAPAQLDCAFATEPSAIEPSTLADPPAVEPTASETAAETPPNAEPSNDNAARLIRVIRTHHNTSLDDLIQETGLPIPELQHTLLLLELQGHIQNKSGTIALAQR